MSLRVNKRSPNFTEGEKMTLIKLVEQYKNVLENKKTDAVSNEKKNKVWEKLTQKFIATSGSTPREASNLRSKYDDLKKILRKKMGNNRCKLYGTGGGTVKLSNLSSEEDVLLSLTGPSTCGLEDRRGGDTEFISNKEETNDSDLNVDTTVDILFDENEDEQSYRPSDAVDILKRSLPQELASDNVLSDCEYVEVEYPSLDSYEKPKKRKRDNDKLDDLIDEYADLKNETKFLILVQTRYYKDRNKRENELLQMDMEIKKIQKEEEEMKLILLKEGRVKPMV